MLVDISWKLAEATIDNEKASEGPSGLCFLGVGRHTQ